MLHSSMFIGFLFVQVIVLLSFLIHPIADKIFHVRNSNPLIAVFIFLGMDIVATFMIFLPSGKLLDPINLTVIISFAFFWALLIVYYFVYRQRRKG